MQSWQPLWHLCVQLDVVVWVPAAWWQAEVGAADLVEEIGRIYGYDHLPMDHLPREHVVAQPSLNPAQARQFRLRRALALLVEVHDDLPVGLV